MTIEHVPNPNEFIANCKRLLKPDGKILITTPSKDYNRKNSIWQNELPPFMYFG